MLEVTDSETAIYMSENPNRAMGVFSEVTNSVFIIYDANFQDIEKLHEVGAVEDLVVSVKFLLCNFSHNLRFQRNLCSTSHDVSETNDIDSFGTWKKSW